jgi:hypothetical protein
MKRIIGIDPGPVLSGYADLWLPTGSVVSNVKTNQELEKLLELPPVAGQMMVIEMVANYGMPSGADIFETCVQIGRFEKTYQGAHERVFRKEVAITLCGTAKAKSANIRQQIIEMYGGTEKAIGGNKCKKCKGKAWTGRNHEVCALCNGTGWLYPPGPLNLVKSHAWSALAVALTYAILNGHLSPLAANPGALCRSSLL